MRRECQEKDSKLSQMITYGKPYQVLTSLVWSLFFIADPSKLVTKWALDVTSRYTYCSDFNCPAFDGSYDDQPNYWIQAVGVMRQARAEASKWRNNG